MAVVHPGAELTPSKQDLIDDWLSSRPWWPEGEPVRPWVASFRFDDPAGQVGIETFLVPLGDAFVHLPLTYRDAPLDGGTLLGRMEHSALGTRWVYEAMSDPVYVAETTAVIREGRGEVALATEDGTAIARRSTTASVRGSGTGAGTLRLARQVPSVAPADATGVLTATWEGQTDPVTLAWLI